MDRPLLPAAEAWAALDARLRPLEPLAVERPQALGRVLARGVTATVDIPAADVSAMDGYGLPATTRERYRVSATVAAGDAPGHRAEPGTAVRIMTGAPVPEGIDRVVPIEDTDAGTAEVRVLAPPPSGAHIRRAGEVLRAGDPLLPPGLPLGATALANLATHGIREVTVHRPPSVAVVTTGDEVVPPEVEPGPGQLRDSHSDFLAAAGRELRLEFALLGIAPDDPAELARRIRRGLEHDVLILGGGVSMGAFDHVEPALLAAGCEIVWHGVAIQPGKPLLAARHSGGWAFGLPGNPNSVMATYTLFVRPVLRRLLGFDDGFWHGASGGVLTGPLREGGRLDRFLPAQVVVEGGEARVTPLRPAGSHDLASFGRADALVRAPAGRPAAEPGDRCEWLPLPS